MIYEVCVLSHRDFASRPRLYIRGPHAAAPSSSSAAATSCPASSSAALQARYGWTRHTRTEGVGKICVLIRRKIYTYCIGLPTPATEPS